MNIRQKKPLQYRENWGERQPRTQNEAKTTRLGSKDLREVCMVITPHTRHQ
jgi:hypothetical protein